MNERIRQLAEQAKLKTELWNNPEPFVIYKEDVNYPGGLEKFAQLIVQDNIRTLRGNGYDDAAQCLQDIHFGIEDPV